MVKAELQKHSIDRNKVLINVGSFVVYLKLMIVILLKLHQYRQYQWLMPAFINETLVLVTAGHVTADISADTLSVHIKERWRRIVADSRD